MASSLDRLRNSFDRFRNPAHTGERRCWPCTAVNALILLVASAGIARKRSRSLASVVAVGGAAVIALRGYLVPYTPQFAPRLVSVLPGDPFHVESGRTRSNVADSPTAADGPTPADDSTATDDPNEADRSGSLGGEPDAEAGERVLSALVDNGIVVAEGEAVSLDDDFRKAWRAEMRDFRSRDDDGLADALRSAAPEGIVVDVVEQGGGRFGDGGTWFVVSDGSDDPANERWLTRPVAIAEAAAAGALDDASDLPVRRRTQAVGPLRTFLESCPVCDGPVVETTVVECCGGPGGTRADAPDEVLACADCDERLYTFR